jgi:SNF2 family DNA or RNA helicase
MSLLTDHYWQLKYTPDDGDLDRSFYVPALECAVRYDRLTGFFSASALALAARGIEGLIRNGGRMRLVVGCTLDPPEVAAIEKGQALREAVEQHLLTLPLAPSDQAMADALELLAWMVGRGILDVKVSIPCDSERRPILVGGIFHEKAGIIEDKTGDKIAFNGSLNETEAGWRRNWESLNVFRSWAEPDRIAEEERNFTRIWADQAHYVTTLDVPSAVRDNLLRFLPADDKPARLTSIDEGAVTWPGKLSIQAGEEDKSPAAYDSKPEPQETDLRRLVWAFIQQAPSMLNGGERVGEATAAVKPWPHQVRTFERLYHRWPPKLLIADEVGLGKTIDAGLLLRQVWLAGRVTRVLIMAPRRICPQWQVELREKFNLNWPTYDGQKLTWYPSPVMRGHHERVVNRTEWLKEPAVIVSSQLMRRRDRAADLEQADPWDLIVLDEAHHARRKGAGSKFEGGPNALLALMQRLTACTQGLILLTATPMQVHPVELWDLLNLLGLPPEWDAQAFISFAQEISHPSPSHESFDHLARLFQASERFYGPVSVDEVMRRGATSRLQARKVLEAMRDRASIPRRQLETTERKIAIRMMWRASPAGRLVTRATRETLRRYVKEGRITTPVADRRVDDRFIELSPGESALYAEVEEYISKAYNQASAQERGAIGFVMTIYRRRLASSFYALRCTLEDHFAVISGRQSALSLGEAEEDAPDDPQIEETLDADEIADREKEGLLLQEQARISELLDRIRKLPPDTKVERLKDVIAALKRDGYEQVMVFTQYTDTMDFLRDQLARDTVLRIMCFSGRGGEVKDSDGAWRLVSRDDIKQRFRQGQADILLCSDAASEGLNFQFCGGLINYDMPWNPMRVEQRIGRIDRLGQRYPEVRVVNLHYADTVEADVYLALRDRIKLFETTIGRLQPILARMPQLIAEGVLQGRVRDPDARAQLVAVIDAQAAAPAVSGFDLDAVAETDAAEVVRPRARLTLDDLDLVIRRPELLPPGIEVQSLAAREYAYRAPGMREPVRVTTDAEYYEQHADSLELWSHGNPLFQPIVVEAVSENPSSNTSLRDLVGRSGS